MATVQISPPQVTTPADSTKRWILIFACLLLLLQTIPLLGTRWVADESWYTAPADSLAHHGELRVRAFPDTGGQGRFEAMSPALMMILAGFFKVLGTSLYSAKAPYLLAGIASILLTYLLGCELESPLLGAIAAVFLAADNMFFAASRTARPEAMTIAFSLAGLVLYLHSQRRNSLLLTACSGLVVGLAFQIHPNGFAAAVTIGILALIEYRAGIVFRSRPWVFVAAMLVSFAPFLVWTMSDPVRKSDLISLYTTGEMRDLSTIPGVELSRYKDFLGIPSQRLKVGIRLPFRLHVVIALVAAALVLFRYNRALLGKMACFILPCILWWAYLRNESVRYTALASPYFAILLAGAGIALWNSKPAWRRMVAAAAMLLLMAQVASNYALLYLYRKANYDQLSARLHELIPPDGRIYGSLVFWMAFNDHPFFAYNRTPLQYAVNHGANYVILNDMIMAGGNGFGIDDWVEIRQQMTNYVNTHGTLVGRAPNPYYGDLEIYRINDAKQPE